MTIEQAIADIEANGFFISNLFQLAGGTWQSNLWDRESNFEFGRGPTAAAALLDALAKAKGGQRARLPGEKPPVPKLTPVVASSPAVTASGSVLD